MARDRKTNDFQINDMRNLNWTELHDISRQGDPALDELLRRHVEQREHAFSSDRERELERKRDR
jgi:hypothetical protein